MGFFALYLLKSDLELRFCQCLGKTSVSKYYSRRILKVLCISMSKSKFNHHFNLLCSQAREDKYASGQHIQPQVKVGELFHVTQSNHSSWLINSPETVQRNLSHTLSSATDVTRGGNIIDKGWESKESPSSVQKVMIFIKNLFQRSTLHMFIYLAYTSFWSNH